MKKAFFILSLGSFFLIQICIALCHPHVFVDAYLLFVFDEGGLCGIRERWVFDEMFSQNLLYDFNTDNDGRLNHDDISQLRDIFYENTEEYNYFNNIKIDGRKYKIERLEDFSISIEDGRIVYEFFVPCLVPVRPNEARNVKISLFDETIYTDLLIADYRVDMQKKPDAFSVDMRYDVLDEVVTPLGSVVPDSLVITFRKK
jgi:ABC-type uncharacterized transport system substrate-binding protein